MTANFPADFIWGASTAAHQIEGNNTDSDFWEIENRDGSFLPERSGDACDSFHRWPEDLDLLAEAGLGAYRFSVDWSRIEPVEGRISRAALAHYRSMVTGCRDRGIEPIVTLHHFTSPRWFAESGGWRAPGGIDRFVRFVSAVLPVVEDVDWLCTINEPNILAMLDAMMRTEQRAELVAGELPPPDDELSSRLIEAHVAAKALLAAGTDAKVGWTVANQNFQAEPGAEELTRQWAWSREDRFIDAAEGDDFIGVQAYTRVRIGSDGPLAQSAGTRRTLSGWEFYPAALGEAVRHTAARLPDVPIVVTENGIATADDSERIEYTRGALEGLAAAIADGVDVRGYLHWSWLDNFEWGSYAPTFGLVAVDRETFQRTVKPSARWLGAVAATGV